MVINRAAQRYTRDIILLSIVYAALLIGAVLAFKHGLATGVTAYLIAILPALPVIGMFMAIGRLLVEQEDEYLRMLMVRQALIATGFALSICTAWGFLENFGLVPHVDSYWVAILWFGGLGIGPCWNKLTGSRPPK